MDWARRFILFHGKRHPQNMGAAEVEALLSHLALQADGAAHAEPGQVGCAPVRVDVASVAF